MSALRQRDRLQRILIATGYLTFLTAATQWTSSVSGWAILGLAPVLWVDRQVLRLLPWPSAQPLLPAIAIRLLFGALAGGFLFHIGRNLRGMVSDREAVYAGVVFSLAVYLLEIAVDLLTGLANRDLPEGKRPMLRLRNLLIISALIVPVVFLSPMTVFHPISLRPNTTPQIAGLEYEDIRLTTADGLELPGWLVPHPEPRGSVLFCHGHGGNRQQVWYLLKPLHELGLNVLCFDFRGQGESPGHTCAFGLREVPDVQAAERFLVERYPNQPVFLFGISYGAAVGLRALPDLPHVRAAWLECGFARLSDVAHKRFEAWPEAVRTAMIYTYASVMLLDSGCWTIDANPIDSLPRCSVPIHFSHGTEDGLIPFSQAVEMYDRYHGPKQCLWVEGAGHANLIGKAGVEYQKRLAQFINAQLTLSASQP